MFERYPCISEWQGLTKLYDQQFTYAVYLAGTHDGLYSMAHFLEMDVYELKEQMLTFGGQYYSVASNIIYPTMEEATNARNYILGICMALKLAGKGKRLAFH